MSATLRYIRRRFFAPEVVPLVIPVAGATLLAGAACWRHLSTNPDVRVDKSVAFPWRNVDPEQHPFRVLKSRERWAEMKKDGRVEREIM